MAKDSRLSVPGGGGGSRAKTTSARKNSNIVGRTVNKNLKDYQNHDIKNMTPSKPNPNVLRPLSDVARASANVTSAIKASNAKSGAAARVGAAKMVNRNWYMSPLGSKPPVIKINSNK